MADTDLILQDIKQTLDQKLRDMLLRSGMMFRLFGRIKTRRSLEHKMLIKGERYRSGQSKIQDVIGFRIVLYFPDDVEVLATHLSCQDLVDSSVDAADTCTFRPQRLNLTKRLPEDLASRFTQAMPLDLAPYIDATYEIQIRTIFSEGWHEVEHDLRYKCKEDWVGYDPFSRALNGVIATLETAEYSMDSIFREMAHSNYEQGHYSAMMRNKLRLRFSSDRLSPPLADYLAHHHDVARNLYKSERMVLIMALLSHKQRLPLTYDHILFLINRFDLMDPALQALESPEVTAQLEAFIAS